MMCVLELLRSYDQESFEENAVTMVGRLRPYLTYNKDKLRHAGLVPNTDLYVELNLSADMIVGLCYGLSEKMGISSDKLMFETD